MTRVAGADAVGWARRFNGVLERIGGRFGRAEPRRRAEAYLRGLLAPVEHQNGWQLAEAAGDATPDGVQEFMSLSAAASRSCSSLPSSLRVRPFGRDGRCASLQTMPTPSRETPTPPAISTLAVTTRRSEEKHV